MYVCPQCNEVIRSGLGGQDLEPEPRFCKLGHPVRKVGSFLRGVQLGLRLPLLTMLLLAGGLYCLGVRGRNVEAWILLSSNIVWGVLGVIYLVQGLRQRSRPGPVRSLAPQTLGFAAGLFYFVVFLVWAGIKYG
jgi:hypothetical protein